MPKYFRGVVIPNYIRNKSQLMRWVFETFQGEKISNWDLATKLHTLRYGGYIHNLRLEGYDIETIRTKGKDGLFYYRCNSVPELSQEFMEEVNT